MFKNYFIQGRIKFELVPFDLITRSIIDEVRNVFTQIFRYQEGDYLDHWDGETWYFTKDKIKIALDYDNWCGLTIVACKNESENPLVEEIAAYLEKDWKQRGVWEKLGYK